MTSRQADERDTGRGLLWGGSQAHTHMWDGLGAIWPGQGRGTFLVAAQDLSLQGSGSEVRVFFLGHPLWLPMHVMMYPN